MSNRATGKLILNENSLSNACGYSSFECMLLSWAWGEPLVTREFQTYTTPVRTYELSLFGDERHEPLPPNPLRV